MGSSIRSTHNSSGRKAARDHFNNRRDPTLILVISMAVNSGSVNLQDKHCSTVIMDVSSFYTNMLQVICRMYRLGSVFAGYLGSIKSSRRLLRSPADETRRCEPRLL